MWRRTASRLCRGHPNSSERRARSKRQTVELKKLCKPYSSFRGGCVGLGLFWTVHLFYFYGPRSENPRARLKQYRPALVGGVVGREMGLQLDPSKL